MATKTEDILSSWASFFVGYALVVRAISARMEGEASLSMDEYDLLLCVSRSPGERIRFSSLAEATLFTRSGVTRVVQRLEKRKFLSREQCPEDKRGAYARITDAGRKALRDSWKVYSKAILEEYGNCFSQAETQAVEVLTNKLAQRYSRDPLVAIGRKR